MQMVAFRFAARPAPKGLDDLLNWPLSVLQVAQVDHEHR
jgi:hypothetical protein